MRGECFVPIQGCTTIDKTLMLEQLSSGAHMFTCFTRAYPVTATGLASGTTHVGLHQTPHSSERAVGKTTLRVCAELTHVAFPAEAFLLLMLGAFAWLAVGASACQALAEPTTDEPDINRRVAVTDREEQRRLLNELAAAVELNYERIRGIKAVANVFDREVVTAARAAERRHAIDSSSAMREGDVVASEAPGPSQGGFVTTRVWYTSQFQYDLLKSRSSGNLIETKRAVDPSRDSSKLLKSFPMNHVLTEDSYYTLHPELSYGQLQIAPDILPSSGRVAFVKSLDKAKKEGWSERLDPRCLFYYGDRRFDEVLRELAGLVSGLDAPASVAERLAGMVEVSKFGGDGEDLIALSIASPSGSHRVTFLHDRQLGGNCKLVQVHIGGDLAQQHDIGYSYDSKCDAYVPVRMSRTVNDAKAERVRSLRVVEVNDYTIGHSFADDDFSFKSLGLENGERVFDEVKEAVYVLKDGELVQPDIATMKASGRSRYMSSLVVINAVAIAVLLWLAYRKRCKTAWPA